MAGLDMSYLATLVTKAQGGDSDAFAEFYAATYPQQYTFAYGFLEDEAAARDVLLESYTRALRELARLGDTAVVLAWLNQITLLNCLKHAQKIEGVLVNVREGLCYSLGQVLTLPFTQAQCILLRYLCGMRVSDVGELLNIPGTEVRQYTRDAMIRLERFGTTVGEGRPS